MATVSYRRMAVRDVRSGGPATISGVVRELTAPVSRPVYLFEQDGLRLRRVTRSGSNGVYSFPNVAAGRQFIVVSLDPAGAYNAVVADRVAT